MFTLPLIALLALAPQMVLKPDIKDGEVITKLRTVKIIVQSDSIVTQVEMYVNDDLRDTATSTPYTFQLDPLAEPEGNEKLTFTAYNTAGQKQSVSMGVTINSGSALGAAVNTDKAKDFFSQSQFDDAIYAARVALKADPNYVPAELLLSHAFLAENVYDKAQEFAEDALKNQPDSVEALSVISAIQLKRAFDSFATEGDRNAVVNEMGDAIAKAIDARHKVLSMQLEKLPSPTLDNLDAYADGAIQGQDYSAVISNLTQAFNNKNFKTDLGDRIAYAQLRLGRLQDLQKTLTLMKSANTLDAYSEALWSALDEYLGDSKGSDDRIKDALLDSGSMLAVQTAQIYRALHRKDYDTMGRLVQGLASDHGQLPETNYYISIYDDRTKDYDNADKSFRDTVLTEPCFFPMYIERGNEALKKAVTGAKADKDYNFNIARHMYTAAQESKPDSVEALTALAVLDLNLTPSNLNDGLKFASAATSAGPSYPAGHYAAANAYDALWQSLSNQADEVRTGANGSLDPETLQKISDIKAQASNASNQSKSELAAAQQNDPTHLGGASLPRVTDIYQYFVNYGPLPVITAP